MKTSFLDLTGLPTESITTMAHGNVTIVLSPSANDVPSSVTIQENENTGEITLTFVYLDKEETEERKTSENLTLRVGKNSGKVLSLTAHPSTKQRKDVWNTLIQGVDKQLNQTTRDNERLNYQIIKNVLSYKITGLLNVGVLAAPAPP